MHGLWRLFNNVVLFTLDAPSICKTLTIRLMLDQDAAVVYVEMNPRCSTKEDWSAKVTVIFARVAIEMLSHSWMLRFRPSGWCTCGISCSTSTPFIPSQQPVKSHQHAYCSCESVEKCKNCKTKHNSSTNICNSSRSSSKRSKWFTRNHQTSKWYYRSQRVSTWTVLRCGSLHWCGIKIWRCIVKRCITYHWSTCFQINQTTFRG